MSEEYGIKATSDIYPGKVCPCSSGIGATFLYFQRDLSITGDLLTSHNFPLEIDALWPIATVWDMDFVIRFINS